MRCAWWPRPWRISEDSKALRSGRRAIDDAPKAVGTIVERPGHLTRASLMFHPTKLHQRLLHGLSGPLLHHGGDVAVGSVLPGSPRLASQSVLSDSTTASLSVSSGSRPPRGSGGAVLPQDRPPHALLQAALDVGLVEDRFTLGSLGTVRLML